jgi:hypothetical protein
MSLAITNILSGIIDPTVSAAKSELIDLITTAENDPQVFIQANAKQLQDWLSEVKSGEMSQDEFDELVDAQKIVARNFALGQEEATQERIEQLTIHVLELAAQKIVPALLVAAL